MYLETVILSENADVYTRGKIKAKARGRESGKGGRSSNSKKRGGSPGAGAQMRISGGDSSEEEKIASRGDLMKETVGRELRGKRGRESPIDWPSKQGGSGPLAAPNHLKRSQGCWQENFRRHC